MCELVNELVNYSIDAHSATNEFELSILWVAEDEMVAVEHRELFSTDAAGDLHNPLAITKFATTSKLTVGI